jgi:hypothetical protein
VARSIKNIMRIAKSQQKANIPELRGSIESIRFPCFGEIKYDGEANEIWYNKDTTISIATCNKYGTARDSWSKLDIIATYLEQKGIKEARFLAELHYGDGKKGDLYQLLSHKDDDNLSIRIYDIINIDNVLGTTINLIDRKEMLLDIFGPIYYVVKSEVINNRKQAEEYFKAVTKIGYEGVVLKPFDGRLVLGPCNWVKLKDKDQNDYQIAMIDPTRERIEIKIPTLGQTPVFCGVKVVNKYKKNLKIGDWVTIEHQGVLESGSLRHPVYIHKKIFKSNNLINMKEFK